MLEKELAELEARENKVNEESKLPDIPEPPVPLPEATQEANRTTTPQVTPLELLDVAEAHFNRGLNTQIDINMPTIKPTMSMNISMRPNMLPPFGHAVQTSYKLSQK